MILNPSALVKALFRNESNEPFICTPYQEAFLKDVLYRTYSKVLFIASTRAGKSEITSIAAILLAILNDGEVIQVISPTWNQSQIVFRKAKNHLYDRAELIAHVDMTNEFSNQEINFKNKSKIHCLSTGGARKGSQVLGFGGSVIILDESEEIEDDIYKTKILRMITSARKPVLLIELGTPHKSNHFKESWQSGKFKVHRVPYTMAVAAGVMNEHEVESVREQLTDLEFKVWFLAEFPDQDEDSLYTMEEIERFKTNPKEVEKGFKVLGVDIARFGADKSVFTYVIKDDEGNVDVKEIWWTEQRDTMQTCGKIIELYNLCKFDMIYIDVVGLGAGVFDRLSEQNYPVFGAHFGQSSIKLFERRDVKGKGEKWARRMHAFNYLNKKAENFFNLKKLLQDGKLSCHANTENAKRLFAELSKITYEFTSNAKIKVTDWERHSPDFADSLVYAIWEEAGNTVLDFGGKT